MTDKLTSVEASIPEPVRSVLRGIGQVFFQGNALTGACFVVGILLSSPLMALGAVVGAAIGTATARLLKFDPADVTAGIHGFNPALVGIATFFFFQPGVVSIAMLLIGCVVATLLTRVMRQFVPFPTYTTPFIVTTWVLFFVGRALSADATDHSAGPLVPTPQIHFAVESVAHGVGQVMFQASLWTGLLFLVGIALSDRTHATWVLVGSIVGMLVGSYHLTASSTSLDPERLIERALSENIALGLYGYNATLAAVALSLWRKSLIPPLLGSLLAVLLTEFVPMLGLPALTAPFVLATWLVLALGSLEGKLLSNP